MDDKTILERISALSDEELELEEHHPSSTPSAERRGRLQAVEIEFDQCWDLLRQRRACRSAGQNPNEAAVRSLTWLSTICSDEACVAPTVISLAWVQNPIQRSVVNAELLRARMSSLVGWRGRGLK